MTTPLAVPREIRTTFAADYAAGGGTATVAAGDGALFAGASPAAPVRFTAITAATYQTLNETKTVFQATGVGGDVLSGVAAVEGTADRAFAAGDRIEGRDTAGTFADLAAAINALERLVSAAGAGGFLVFNAAGLAALGGNVVAGQKLTVYGESGSSLDGPLLIKGVTTSGNLFGVGISLDALAQAGYQFSFFATGLGAGSFAGAGKFGVYCTDLLTFGNYCMILDRYGQAIFGQSAYTNLGQLSVYCHTPGTSGVAVQGATDQINPLYEARDSLGALRWAVKPDGSMGPTHLADGAAANDSVYYSTTLGKLVYKDGSGTVNPLY